MLHRRRALQRGHDYRRYAGIRRCLERSSSGHRHQPQRARVCRARNLRGPRPGDGQPAAARTIFLAQRQPLCGQAAHPQHGDLRAHESCADGVYGQVRLHLLHECADLFFARPAGAAHSAVLRLSRTRRISFPGARGIDRPGRRYLQHPCVRGCAAVPEARGFAPPRGRPGESVSEQSAEFVEIFLQEASEHLQFLREYCGILQDAYPQPEDVERLFISAHTLGGTSASYGFPLFSEVSGKLAHIFQYGMNATIAPDAAGPLVEFISEAIAVLESDLLMISANAIEAMEDISTFKQRFPFAFQAVATSTETQEAVAEAPAPARAEERPQETESYPPVIASEPVPTAVVETEPAFLPSVPVAAAPVPAAPVAIAPAPIAVAAAPVPKAAIPLLPQDSEVPAEILEFFVPEAEEHLQVVTDCLLSLETNPNPEEINRLLRAMHTVKGSAAQVGLQRIARVAHRAEDLIGRLREGALRPSAEIIDICLEAVDILKKFLYRQWTDEKDMQAVVQPLFTRIGRLAPEEQEVVVETSLPSVEATPLAGQPEAPASADAAIL